MLHRDLTQVQVRPGTHDCVVVSGVLHDRYTGKSVTFTKADAAEVPIDHVVPLAAAWTEGAAAWPAAKRQAFANDLNNLIATTREENSAKGDSTADEWVPADAGYGCSYATVDRHGEEPIRPVRHPGRGGRTEVAARHLLRPRRGITVRDRAVGEPCRAGDRLAN